MNDWLEYNLFFFGTQTKHKTLVFWGVKPVKPSRSLWATRTELWFDVSEEGLIDWLYGDLPGIPESQANVNEQILLYLKIASAFLIDFWDAPFWCAFISQVVFLYYTKIHTLSIQIRDLNMSEQGTPPGGRTQYMNYGNSLRSSFKSQHGSHMSWKYSCLQSYTRAVCFCWSFIHLPVSWNIYTFQWYIVRLLSSIAGLVLYSFESRWFSLLALSQ